MYVDADKDAQVELVLRDFVEAFLRVVHLPDVADRLCES